MIPVGTKYLILTLTEQCWTTNYICDLVLSIIGWLKHVSGHEASLNAYIILILSQASVVALRTVIMDG